MRQAGAVLAVSITISHATRSCERRCDTSNDGDRALLLLNHETRLGCFTSAAGRKGQPAGFEVKLCALYTTIG